MALTTAPAEGLILAVDVGSSSLRTGLFDLRGTRYEKSTAQQSYPLHTDVSGAAELHPEQLFRALLSCLEATLEAQGKMPALRKKPVLAVGMSCFWHSALAVSKDGTSPIYTWADSRSRGAAAELRKRWDESEVHGRTGCMLRASFWPARLAWLRQERGVWLRQVRQWLSPADWLLQELCGTASTSLSMASGTGLLDAGTLQYEADWVRLCGVKRSQLLPLGPGPHFLAERFRKKFPILAECPWFAAIGDGAASNLGSGACEPSRAAINIGTSAAVRVVVPSVGRRMLRAPLGLFCYRVDERRALIGGAVSNAGNLRDWCMRELRLEGDASALEKQLARRVLPEHGLRVLPFWTSERAPTWCEELPGVIYGLRASTTALDVLQATTEAVYQRLAWIAEQLPQGGKSGRSKVSELEFVVSGGVRRSVSALQRLSNVLGAELEGCSEPEASLRGAAVYALERLGYEVSAPLPGVLVQPQRRAVELYRKQGLELRRLESVLQGFVG